MGKGKDTRIVCCFCGRLIDKDAGDWPCNPEPLKDSLHVCCKQCDLEIVFPARLNLCRRNEPEGTEYMIAIKSVAAMQVPVLVYKDGTTFELTPGAMVNDPARVRGAISRYVSEEHKMFDDALKSVCFVKAFLQEQLDESTELLRDLVVHTELDELEDITRRAGEFLLKKDDENERDNDNDERERRTADADTGN